MEFHDWEFEMEIANGKRAFYALCRQSIEHQGLMDHINAEHPQLLGRIALEIDIGELACSALPGENSFEKAIEYFLFHMAFASNNEQFYGIDRAPWIKDAVIQFLEKDVHVSSFDIEENIPGSLLADRDVLRGAISARAINILSFNSDLLQAHADDLLLVSRELFSYCLHKQDMDINYIASLIIRNPSLYAEVEKHQENERPGEISAESLDKIQKRLHELNWNPRAIIKKNLVKRIRQAVIDTFSL